MTHSRWLSRVRLGSAASVKALMPLLQGNAGPGGHGSVDVDRRLVWSLFADSPDRRRDFLWRRMDDDAFLVLSARPPENRHGLFEIDEPKAFAPVLAPGDRLRFSLRANPTVRKARDPERRHAPRHDVVMDALHPLPDGSRAERRMAAIREKGFDWLARQGCKAGFEIREEELLCEGYCQHRIDRGADKHVLSFSSLDFEGVLEVRDPDLLPSAIARGFGPAKAFGCGLMLIRRL